MYSCASGNGSGAQGKEGLFLPILG
jgi:hypothetical protein